MADGVRLSARLWMPEQASDEPVAVVLEYIPYRKRDSYRMHDDAWGAVLAGAGIAFARVDVRGTGDSEGTISDEYSEQELGDGEAIIGWLADQAWCNGQVGMRGISWGGINTLQMAARQPPALKAIVSMAAVDNRFTGDAHYIGGLLGRPNLDWGVLFKAVLAGPPDPEITGGSWIDTWLERLKATTPVITEWMRHQDFDDYWQRGSVGLDHDAIRVPTYLVAGWYDTYVDFVGRMLAGLNVPCKGFVGPWGHTYPELPRPGGVDWATEEVRWWRHWLLGEENGIMREPAFRAFMPYRTPREVLPDPVPGRWIAEQAWPVADPTEQVFWLSESGLGAQAEPGGERTFVPSEPVGVATAEWGELPEEQSADDALSLVFDCEPLADDLEILGYPSLTVEVLADQPVASLMARLTDVDPRGRSWLVSYAVLNLTHRNGHVQPEPLTAGETYRVRLNCLMAGHRFKRGHRVRIALSDGPWPMTWPVPTRAELKFALEGCSLSLPIRPIEARSEPLHIAAHSEPAREPPGRLRSVKLAEDGARSYATNSPASSYEVPGTGTTLSGRSESRIALTVQGDSQWQREIRRGWQRGDWHCEVVAGCEISADAGTFTVREYLRAFRDDEQIYEQDETLILPRRLI